MLQVLTSADGNGAKGVAMSATLVLFGGSTTGAWPRFALDPSTSLDPSPPSSLHARAGMLAWVSGTYVLGMRALPGKKVAIDTPTLLGGVHTTECDWSEIGRPGAQCRPVPGASLPVLHASVLNPPPPLPGSYHPFSTFGAKGAVFWLDEDGTLVDPQVLQKIEAALNRDY